MWWNIGNSTLFDYFHWVSNVLWSKIQHFCQKINKKLFQTTVNSPTLVLVPFREIWNLESGLPCRSSFQTLVLICLITSHFEIESRSGVSIFFRRGPKFTENQYQKIGLPPHPLIFVTKNYDPHQRVTLPLKQAIKTVI